MDGLAAVNERRKCRIVAAVMEIFRNKVSFFIKIAEVS